jgi:hypothetical protein
MPIRARDLRVNIAEMGFERGVVHTLELALEDMSAIRSNMRDAAELLQGCIDQMDRFLAVSEGLQTRIDQLRRDQQVDEYDEPGS